MQMISKERKSQGPEVERFLACCQQPWLSKTCLIRQEKPQHPVPHRVKRSAFEHLEPIDVQVAVGILTHSFPSGKPLCQTPVVRKCCFFFVQFGSIETAFHNFTDWSNC